MMKYTIEQTNPHIIWVKVEEKNAKKETMVIEIHKCYDSGGRSSLPKMWYKSGFTNSVMKNYLICHTYVTDSEGNCSGRYNPTIKIREDGEGMVMNFEWLLDDNEENIQKIIDECIRRFESAVGKTATEIKIEKIQEYCKENNLELVFSIPDGWEKKHLASDPFGATSIINNQPSFIRVNGKLKINPKMKRKILVERMN